MRIACRLREGSLRVSHIQPLLHGETNWGRLARCSRRVVSVLVLGASLTALALVVHNHQAFWFGDTGEGTLAEESTADEGQVIHAAAAISPAEDNRYRALSDSVARRYRVSQEMAYDLVHLAHTVGQQHGLDPLLIIAVIAIESRFNPIAESIHGARGLMQVIPKYHTAKLAEYGGEKALFDPVTNVKVGARILKDYIRLTGNLGIALQMYGGALSDGEDQYTTKVMNEQQRLKQVLSPASRASSSGTSTAAPRPASLTSQ